MARIGGIQRSLERSFNPYLADLELKLNRELSNILNQEEMMWYQKSRTKWINEGDRNTNYYHTKTIIRRRSNRILMMRDAEGRWLDQEELIILMMTDFYKNLFMEEKEVRPMLCTISSFPQISELADQKLMNIPTPEEVKQAFFAIRASKAPWC